MTEVYRTPTDRAVVSGWQPLGALPVEVTTLPLLDATEATYLAHLDYRGALAVAAREGARLPMREEIEHLRVVGHLLRVVILPDAEQLAAMPLRGSGETERAYQARIRRDMSSLAWCQRHDRRVVAQLEDWDGLRPVANAGKHWLVGAPAGRAYLMGWWSSGRWIQQGTTTGQGPHDDRHADYATTTILVRDRRDR